MGLIKIGIVPLVIICLVYGQEDSLQSALRAVDRRQRDLSHYSKYDRYDERPEDPVFLTNSDYSGHGYEPSNTPSSYDYAEYDPYTEPKAKKTMTSPFRERVEQDRERQLEQLARIYLKNFNTPNDFYDNDEYNELVREMYDKYKIRPSGVRNSVFTQSDLTKRQYYPAFGLDSVGLKKKSRYFEPDGPTDSLHLLSYAPRDEVFDKLKENDDVDNPNLNIFKDKYLQKERKYDHKSYPFSINAMKRFPVTKRSSAFSDNEKDKENSADIKEHKKEVKQVTEKSSPKHKNLKTLREIRATSVMSPTVKPKAKPKQHDNTTRKAESLPEKTRKINGVTTTATKNNLKAFSKPANTKEVAYEIQSDKPLQIKKKSIDWSDYFGLDRRKKSQNGLDGDWLLERYHKAIDDGSKRDAIYQLKSFKNHDEPPPKQTTTDASLEKNKKTDYGLAEESKIDDMDAKLKAMEDSIIDDAIKFTGAHEGVSDSKEIQGVKDKVISRLAAAYSLEKMRRALGEYKLCIAKEKERLFAEQTEDYQSIKEKRLSVPRKQAIDDERENIGKEDNEIKCTSNDEDCEEQHYKTPSDIVELTIYGTGNCPKIEKACKDITTVLGHYARAFQSACSMHQMCLLCGNNSWFAPTRQCNVLFLSKTYELCGGNPECQREAQRSVRHMLDMNRSLRAEPMEDCDLSCPDNREEIVIERYRNGNKESLSVSLVNEQDVRPVAFYCSVGNHRRVSSLT